MLAYFASLLIGLALGLLGGGGSILTLPVLVYLFGVSAVEATAYSLFIVGATALASIVPKARAGEIDFKTALWFGLPSIAAVYVTRSVLMPAIPDPIWSAGTFALGKGTALMLLFAVLLNGIRHQCQVRARITRVTQRGIGVEFGDPLTFHKAQP